MAGSVRGGDVQNVGEALGVLLSGPLGRGLSAAGKAARAWYAANGDRERAHTTGVWLRKSGRAGIDPVLVVALDSNLLAMELGTNKDLYLSRLAFRGVAISDIAFVVRGQSKKHAAEARARAARTSCTSPGELPPLSPADERRVARATADLPDGLRQSVSRAMRASLRRDKGTRA